MGCISSKILTRSGSLRDKAGSYHGVQRSSSQLIEDIILSKSNPDSKTNGESQPTFLALLRTTSSSSSAAARKSIAAAAEQSPASAATPAAAAAMIETIDVSELLAGLEEEEEEGQEDPAATAAAASEAVQDETAAQSGGAPDGHGDDDDAGAGAKRRARGRQLRGLSAPEAAAGFDFGKSGSLRDWLRGGGQIFSPGSYVTPKFGSENNGGRRPRHEEAVFDPELVAQLELAMEELSVDEERVVREVLESLDAGEKRGEEAERLLGLELVERPPKEQATPLVA